MYFLAKRRKANFEDGCKIIAVFQEILSRRISNNRQNNFILESELTLALSVPGLFFPEKRVFSLEERRIISRTAAGNETQRTIIELKHYFIGVLVSLGPFKALLLNFKKAAVDKATSFTQNNCQSLLTSW